MKSSTLQTFSLLFLFTAAIYLTHLSQQASIHPPQQPLKNNNSVVAVTKFSTERALQHIKKIADQPHYTGSKNHENVKRYIVSQLQQMGLMVEIQRQVAINTKSRRGAEVQNILTRIKGSDNTKALLLLSHYDSAPSASFGASDAGSGVAILLEGLRAFLKQGHTFKNDIIILFSDAEEIGLLGANAFVKHHRWAKGIGLVLNFEARGSGGPVYMFMETNSGNMKMVQQFAKAGVSTPVATSLMYSIYKLLPNDTDLTVFREEADISGFNFAYIDDHYDYHTSQDSYQRIDERSIQHLSDYLVPLLDHFTNVDLTNIQTDDNLIYFNIPFAGIFYYPYSWTNSLLIVTTLLFLATTFYGHKKQQLTFSHFFISAIPFFLSLFLSVLTAYLGWKLLLFIRPHYADMLQGFTYNGHYYIAAFTSLTIAIFLAVYSRFFDRYQGHQLLLAPIAIWLLLNLALSLALPGAAYFIIAPIIATVVLALYLKSDKNSFRISLLAALIYIPVLLIFSPMVEMLTVGLGLQYIFISSSLIIFVFGLALPIFSNFKHLTKLSIFFAILSSLFFLYASSISGFDEQHKKPNSIIYFQDNDRKQSWWASYDSKPDSYTQQFLGSRPDTGSFVSAENVNIYTSYINLHQQTDYKALPHARLAIIDDYIQGNERTLEILITPTSGSNRIELITNQNIEFSDIKINGETLIAETQNRNTLQVNRNRSIIRYQLSAIKEQVKIKFTVAKETELDVSLYETTYNFLNIPAIFENETSSVHTRNKTMMQKPFLNTDSVVIKSQLRL